MKHSYASCDWCGKTVTECLIVYTNRYLKSHWTYEGYRDTHEFCSNEHLVAWQDEHKMRRSEQARTHRVRPGSPDDETVTEYRKRLIAEIDDRIARALVPPDERAN